MAVRLLDADGVLAIVKAGRAGRKRSRVIGVV